MKSSGWGADRLLVAAERVPYFDGAALWLSCAILSKVEKVEN